MGQPTLLPLAFDGMVQDVPRNALPKGRAWNMVDYVPQTLGAPAEERGPWAYASPDLSGVDTGATYSEAVAYAPFTGGAQLLAINDTGNLCKITSATVASKIGAIGIPKQKPLFLQNVLAVLSPNGTTAPNKYDGATIAALGASAPAAQYGCVYANRMWLANTVAEPQRIYASAAGDATTYDTSNGWIDASGPVTGLAALPSVMLVFLKDHTMRLKGSTPPPITDMTADDPLFEYGCTDARSIAVNGPNCCFANPTGIYLTNGTVVPTDLTLAVGLKTYWRNLLSSYDSSTWSLAGEWYGSLYVMVVMNGSTFVDCIVFDIRKTSAIRFSNIKGLMLAPAVQAGQELYVASRAAPRILSLSTMWQTSASNRQDADGTSVLGVYESPFYEPKGIGSQRWRDVYLQYDVRDAATSSPTMTVEYITSPDSTSYTSCSPALGATTKKTTSRRSVRVASVGMGFRIVRANPASAARLYAIGATMAQREGSRRLTG